MQRHYPIKAITVSIRETAVFLEATLIQIFTLSLL